MRRVIIHGVVMVGVVLALAGCGFADSRSPVPEFMRGVTIDVGASRTSHT